MDAFVAVDHNIAAALVEEVTVVATPQVEASCITATWQQPGIVHMNASISTVAALGVVVSDGLSALFRRRDRLVALLLACCVLINDVAFGGTLERRRRW